MTWQFGVNDTQTVKLWSEKVIRDADKTQWWAPVMYPVDGDAKTLRHPDAGKGGEIIAVHTDFQNKSGDRVTIHNVAQSTGRGVHGDGYLKNTGATISTYTMNLFYENVAYQIVSSGELSERRTVMNFREHARKNLASWARRKTEGAIVLSLWGLTAPNNSSVLTNLNWNTTESEVFLNTIQAFDSDHILYAGDATSDATIDSADVLTAQLITKAETKALEDLSIPLEMVNIDGEDCFILFTSGRGAEQLRYDPDWRDAQGYGNTRSSDNPLLKRAIGKYSKTYVVEYPNCLNPAANVCRSILAGKNALQMAKVEDWSWFEDYTIDTRKRRKAISIGGFFGMAPTYFNSTRRNALAIDHYVRT